MLSVEYETPQSFFDRLNMEFGFTLDAAASHENAKCPRYFTKEDNALLQDWVAITVWLNPPYDTAGAWIQKAYQESQKGATVVCLMSARATDTKWWHRYAMQAEEIRFIKNRLYFKVNGRAGRSNHGSLLLIFRPGSHFPFCSSMDAYDKKQGKLF